MTPTPAEVCSLCSGLNGHQPTDMDRYGAVEPEHRTVVDLSAPDKRQDLIEQLGALLAEYSKATGTTYNVAAHTQPLAWQLADFIIARDNVSVNSADVPAPPLNTEELEKQVAAIFGYTVDDNGEFEPMSPREASSGYIEDRIPAIVALFTQHTQVAVDVASIKAQLEVLRGLPGNAPYVNKD
jgi:hypothetical protein